VSTPSEQPLWPVIGFDRFYGLELIESGPELVRARVAVRDELRQGDGVVHGGVFASIAEALAAYATDVAVAPDGARAMGMANSTSFLRPISDGTIHAVARRRHRGRTTWVWDVELSDDTGKLCAMTRMTIAVRQQVN
jgi:1,4-dihydroxy-2-naphthoyl-CoA hydrolase